MPSDPLYPQQWSLPKIGWDSAFGNIVPSGNVIVAILDTGVEASHPDLVANIVPGTSILDGSNGFSDPPALTVTPSGISASFSINLPTVSVGVFSLSNMSLGAGFLRQVSRHILPSALTPIVVSVTFGIPEAIFTEAALSFIGVGINPPTPSWGQMVGENQQFLLSYWHLCLFPSIAIAITMLSFTFFGDGVRDALDPKMQ